MGTARFPPFGMPAFDDGLARFAIGDLPGQLGGREPPVENDEPGARPRASEKGEVKVETILAHKADERARKRNRIDKKIGDARGGAIEFGEVDCAFRRAQRRARRIVSCPLFGILAECTNFMVEPHPISPERPDEQGSRGTWFSSGHHGCPWP